MFAHQVPYPISLSVERRNNANAARVLAPHEQIRELIDDRFGLLHAERATKCGPLCPSRNLRPPYPQLLARRPSQPAIVSTDIQRMIPRLIAETDDVGVRAEMLPQLHHLALFDRMRREIKE